MRPDDFVPERWYSKPELILDRSGFAPFSLGKSPTTIPLGKLSEDLQSGAVTSPNPERLSFPIGHIPSSKLNSEKTPCSDCHIFSPSPASSLF